MTWRLLLAAFTLSLTVPQGFAQARPAASPPGFDDLKNRFAKMSQDAFTVDSDASWRTAGAYVSKQFVARSISAAIASAAVRINVSLPETKVEAKYAEVFTDKLNDYPCNADRGCNSNCDWWDLDCHAKKLDCERLKAMEKGECELGKSLQQSISHKKILTVFLYDIDDDSSDVVRASGAASAAISGVSLNDQLTGGELRASVDASVRLSAKVRLKFEPAVKAALVVLTRNPGCIVDQDNRFRNQLVHVDEPQLHVPIVIPNPTVEGDHLKVQLQFQPTTILLKFDSHPVARLFTSDARNLLNLISCPLPIASVLVTEEFFPNDFMKKDQSLPAIATAKDIAAIKAPVAGAKFLITPVNTTKALGVKAERQKK